MATVFCSSVDYAAVTSWAASTVYSVGALRKQTAPSIGNERVFRCTTAGTSGATEPTWILTVGATTADNTVVWTEVTGQSAYNAIGGAWSAPHARLWNSIQTGWLSGGDTVYVASTHAETGNFTVQATHNFPTAAGVSILCVNKTTGARAATATITTTSTAATNTFTGRAYIYGISWTPSATGLSTPFSFGSASSTTPGAILFENCGFLPASTNAGLKYNLGPATASTAVSNVEQRFKFLNCGFKFNLASQSFVLRDGFHEIVNATFSGTTAPTTLTTSTANSYAQLLIRDTTLPSVTNMSDVSLATGSHDITYQNCKVPASVSPTTGSFDNRATVRFKMINCDSAGTNYRFYYADYTGTVQQETSITRTGGASNGTTLESHQMAASAASLLAFWPQQGVDLVGWVNTTGAHTATVYFAHSAASALTNADIWADIEYLGSAASPLYSIVSGQITDPLIGTPSAWPTDSTSTWNGSAQTFKQSLSVSFTPAQVGPFRLRVMLGKASTTVYVDPLVVVS